LRIARKTESSDADPLARRADHDPQCGVAQPAAWLLNRHIKNSG
jgi:hypothetical protein